MRIIRTEKQKDNFAKYLYDLSKIIFTIAVISPIVKPESIDKYIIIVGSVVTLIFLIFASRVDNYKFKNNE